MFAALAFPVAVAAVLARLIVTDIFDDVGSWLGGGLNAIFNAVKDFVVGMVRHFIQYVLDGVNLITGMLSATIQWVANASINLFNHLAGLLDWWVGVLSAGIQAARDLAGWLAGQLTAFVNQVAGVLYGLIVGVLNTAIGAVHDLLEFVIQHVWNPLMSLVSGVIDFATKTLPAWVNSIVNNLWCFVRDVAGSIANIAGSVVDDALGPFKTLLAAGLMALKWIVWMALHPFDWFTKLLDDFLHHRSDWLLEKLSAAIEHNAETVDGWLARFFE